MDEENVEPQEKIDAILEQPEVVPELSQEKVDDVPEEKSQGKTMIPLSVAQKLREQKRELELELQWERQRNAEKAAAKPVEEDNSRYESATKEDLNISQEMAIRAIEERMWIKQNPEKYEKVNEFLPQFLKQRPNLASAINLSTNRYEEAYTLMEALTPKQQQQIKAAATPKKEAPNSPGGVPKAASMNQAVDVMSMNDAEFSAWRLAQKKRR